MVEEIKKRLALAIATICNYICLDKDYGKYEKCRERCIDYIRDRIEEIKASGILKK